MTRIKVPRVAWPILQALRVRKVQLLPHKAEVTESQEAVIAFLSAGASYGQKAVERHETHGSIVFLAGERAYKLKRAVRYPYMDYSTLALRRAACEAELMVNRRTAPQLYLDAVPIVRDGGGLRFGTRAEGTAAVDWVVVMRRFPQSALLKSMAQKGALTADLMRELADGIAVFHRDAEVVPGHGGAAGIRRVIDECETILRSFANPPSQPAFRPELVQQWAIAARRELAQVAALLEQRREQGFVRRCHGDLHLNNICLIDGRPLAFDGIEFSDDFSCIDVLYDLAFLLMDLEHHRLRPLANVLFNRYVAAGSDGLAALPIFLSCRAAVRAHVTATQVAQGAEPAAALLRDAGTFLANAVAYLKPEPPRLVVLGGVSGTGKSTLARAIAPQLGRAPGALILRSDVIRKTLLGVEESQRLPQEGYAAAITAQVYALVAERARSALRAGQCVVADAVFGTEEERAQIEAVAHAEGIDCRSLWLHAPAPILEQRIAQRRGDASDATIDVLRRQLRDISVPPGWRQIDVSGTPAQSVAAIEATARRRDLHATLP